MISHNDKHRDLCLYRSPSIITIEKFRHVDKEGAKSREQPPDGPKYG
jgi:hypothetical protein